MSTHDPVDRGEAERVTRELRYRRAVRAVVLSPGPRILLVRLVFPMWQGWALPGGGVDAGEADLDAIRRELDEEVGLVDPVLAGPIWERTHLFPEPIDFDGQTERIYLVECAAFAPAPRFDAAQLRAEGLTDLRWWTLAELQEADEAFAPPELPALLARLVADGAPDTILTIA